MELIVRRIVAVVVSMVFCASHVLGQDGVTVGFEDRTDAAQVRVKERGVVVFRDEREWRDFWVAHHESNFAEAVEPAPLPPYVDFRRRTLIAIFWGGTSGCRSGATYVERVRGIIRDGADLAVSIQPLGSLGLCRAVSWPLQIIEVPRVPGNVLVTGALPSDR